MGLALSERRSRDAAADPRWLLAAVGEDGTARVWSRLDPDAREVVRLAYAEAQELDHPCLADEHLLPGLLGTGEAGRPPRCEPVV